MRTRLMFVAAVCMIGAGAAVASASTLAVEAARPLPIVTVGTANGGVQVGTSLPGQPLLSVSADNRGVCFGFSLQVGTCIPVATG